MIDHSGASEIGPWGYADAERRGLHVLESEFIAEFFSTESGKPAAEGELSHLVLTSLGRYGMPVIRYRTGDLVRYLPDGRSGSVANGDVIDVDRLGDWFPHRGESVARTARRWYGAPYLWGGVTLNGVDCSGFTQAVMWMHAIALPRDSDLQERAGTPVTPGSGLAELRPGDLLFFAEQDARISHVAISLGGPIIIHSALGNGGVHINDLTGSEPFERKLAEMFVSARRLLAD